VARTLRQRLEAIPGAADVHLAQVPSAPNLMVDVDRSMASQFGLSERDVASDLLVSLSSSGQVAPSFWLDPKRGVQYLVAVQTPQYRIDSLQALSSTPLATGTAGAPPQLLSNVASLRRGFSPQNITHYNVARTFDVQANVDGTDLAVNGAAPNVTNPIAPGLGVSNSGPYHSKSFTQEVRLTSKGEGPLSYVAGAFFADAKTNRSFQRGPALILASWYGEQSTRSIAAFAGLDYKFPTKTTLSGAVRVNNERIEDFFVNRLPTATVYVSPTSIGTCGAGSQQCAGRNEDTVATWKLSVNQEIAPRVSVYASAATGYKGYAYDISSGYTPLRTQNPVRSETSTSYETGLKSRFFDNRLQLNIAAFYTDYDNFQAQSSQYINGALQQKLNNVGKLRTKGLEVEAQAMPVEWLRLDASAAYTDAQVLSFPNAACYPGQAQTGTGCAPSTNPTGLGNVQDRSNTQLPNSPKFKINLGAMVTRDLGNDMKGMFGLNYQHQSKVNFDLLGNPLAEQKAYGLLNGSAAIERGNVKATVFVNNLLNEHFVSGIGDGFGSYGVHLVTQVLSRDSDRYFGLKVDTKF
jgi:iron complex outermembrane receptor protein